jgi:UDP-2,3-diacylglucosamine hydrolase
MTAEGYRLEEPLAIIAGKGNLPRTLVQARLQAGLPTYILAIEGTTPSELTMLAPHAWVKIAAVGQSVQQLRAWGVTQIVMAGSVKRPPLKDLMPDALGRDLLKRLGGSLFSGDDALLRTIMRFLEEQGFRMVGAHDICHGLLTPKGVLTRTKPDSYARKDRDLGLAVLEALSPYDIGQAVVVHHGQVLGIEGREGTAALITRCTALHEGSGAVLVKTSKKQQELRADMPAVGVDTIIALREGGYVGLCLGAGVTMMLGKEAMIAEADAAKLFIEGISGDSDI